MTAISSVAFLAPAAVDLPQKVPPISSVLALAALGIVNTGLAYWLFYLLIDEAGAATASVITYVIRSSLCCWAWDCSARSSPPAPSLG